VVCNGKSKGAVGKSVVLSFLFKRKPGVYNKFIDDLDFFNLPNPTTKRRAILASLFIPRIFYSSDYQEASVLKPFDFYTYQGSLTAPPCTERTIHYVAADPIYLGSTAIELFQEAARIPDMINQKTGDIVRSDIPPENNRLIQPLNGRAVFFFDKKKFCGNEKELSLGGRRKKKGHFEKINPQVTEYYFVNGPKPSGLPGALVVSKKEAMGTMGK